MPNGSMYDKGDTVPETGEYVCSPCGYRHQYQAGEHFGECTSCLSGTDDGHPEYVDGSGLWEKAIDTPITE